MKPDAAQLFLSVFFLMLIVISLGSGYSQDQPIAIKILGAWEQQNEVNKVSEAVGFGLSSQFIYRPLKNVDLNLRIDYEQMRLTQQDVLFEWEWDYWEGTYVDFLPGITPEELNSTLQYTSSDSIYSATFVPTQQLKELKFSTGIEYHLPAFKNFQPYLGVNLGVSLFYRELKMTEHWIKRYKIDSLSTARFDYEFNYDLTHFAPTRKGEMIFAEPLIGGRLVLTPALDLDLSYHFVRYFRYKDIEWLADLLNMSGDRWFPLESKSKLMLGFTFKF